MNNTNSNKNSEHLAVLLGAFLISFSPVFVKIADVSSTVAGVYRVLFGAITLLIYAFIKRDKFWKGWPQFILAITIGFVFAVDLTAWHKSIHYIGPGLSTILGNFQVLLLSAFGVFILKEKLSWRFKMAVPLGLLGLILIFGWDWQSLDANYKLGFLLGLATAISYATFTLTLRHSQSRPDPLSPLVNLIYISLSTTFFMSIFSLILGERFAIPNLKSWGAMLGYGVICQALAWLLISRSLPKLRASLVGLILLLQPTLSFVWDMLLFGRPTTLYEMFGVIMALAAIYLGSSNRNGRK